MSFVKHEKNGVLYYTSSLFDKFSIPHFFASKRGGVSGGDFCSLNISSNRKNRSGKTDDISNIRKNLNIGLDIVGKNEGGCTLMKQIHSAQIEKACISAKAVFDGKGDFGACDGIFTMKGMQFDTLCTKTADCVPVLLYDTENDVAFALHAGWRGTVSNICGRAVEKMRELNCNANIVAAIGPCICDCCYEVNDTVYNAAREMCQKLCIPLEKCDECFPKKYFADGENKYRAALSSLNRLFLENAGVLPQNIDEAHICTCCHADEQGSVFFSHRASGGFSGTQMSVIGIRE